MEHDFCHGLSQKIPGDGFWRTRWGRRCCATATCWKSCTLSSPPKWETLTWCGREGNQGRYRLNPFRKGSLGAISKFLSNCLSATDNVTLVSNNHGRFVNCDFGDITDMIQVPVLYFNDYGRKSKSNKLRETKLFHLLNSFVHESSVLGRMNLKLDYLDNRL